MKLNAAGLKKIFHNRDAWIVLGGAAAAVTAIAVVSGRSGSSSRVADSFAYPDDQGIGGASDVDDRLSKIEEDLLGLTSTVPASDAGLFVRSGPSAASTGGGTRGGSTKSGGADLGISDHFGNAATLEDIFSADYRQRLLDERRAQVAAQTASASGAAATGGGGGGGKVVVDDALASDRFGNKVTIAQLVANAGRTLGIGAGRATTQVAAGAATVAATGGGKVGSGAASVGALIAGLGTTTYIGGGASPLVDGNEAALSA